MAVRWRRPRSRAGVLRALGLILLALMCVGSIVLVVLMDQTTLVGVAYLRAVNSGQGWGAELLGDQFSEDRDWHQRFFDMDIQRDMGYLSDAEVSDVTATREQTLSGQWVTMVRFNWRGGESLGQWRQGALRVKTDKWFVFTYIRAVEETDP